MNRFIALLTGVILSSSLQAKILYYGSEQENISLQYGKSTLFRFDEEVKTITEASSFAITPANHEIPDYRVLSIKPRSNSSKANISFILANNAVVNVRLTTTKKKRVGSDHSFYDLKAKRAGIKGVDRSPKGDKVSEMQLMKGMIRGDKVLGYELKNHNRRVRSGTSGIDAKLIRSYSGPRFHGYIFKIINKTRKEQFAIDLSRLTFGKPNVALLSQLDSNVLNPRLNEKESSTLLRIVTKPTSVHYAVTLPIAPIKNPK